MTSQGPVTNGDLSHKSNAVGNEPSYIIDGDPGQVGGGTYTAPSDPKRMPTTEDWENVFGPAGRDVKMDLQRNKKYTRFHLPDVLKGSNPFLADKIDGKIDCLTCNTHSCRIPFFNTCHA